MTSRPQRERFADDRLLGAGISFEESAVDYAFAPFDRAMRQTKARWVCDRPAELAKSLRARLRGKALSAFHTAPKANHNGALLNFEVAEISLIGVARDFSRTLADRTDAMLMQYAIRFDFQSVGLLHV
jgi:hypothetical protein